MKYLELVDACNELEKLLKQYAANEPDALLCLSALTPLFEKIKQSSDFESISKIPGGYYFHEGSLRKYEELEDAYSRFAVLARGLDPEDIEKFMDSL